MAYDTAQARYAPVEYVDSCTGQAFAPTEDQSAIEEHQVQGGSIFPHLRVNRFMMMSRLAQHWLMDFYSQVLDQRMSIIGKIRNRIMMGQTMQTSDDLTEHEEQDRRVAGYIHEPKNESCLPSSVHGFPCHMAALAKNALILVSVLVVHMYSLPWHAIQNA
jgi:hypothetical protein